jgi:tetratricopeptide (TPR) repeat protein
MRSLRPRLVAVTAAVACLVAAAPARANDQSEVDKVRAAYLAQRYDEAETRLREMLDPKNPTVKDPALVTQARMYLAAVLIAKKDPDAAGPVLERIMLDDPTYEPDPLSFPTEVIDDFIDTRSKLRDRLNAEAQERARRAAEKKAREEEQKRREAARLAMLERLAGEEKLTSQHSRWLALVPFGVGQFQNGDRALGWIFLGTEAACVAGTAITVPIFLQDLEDRSNAYRAGDLTETNEYIARANTVRDVNLVFAGAFAAIAITGVVEAQANFVPESVELRKRPLPSAWVLPTVAPTGDGRGGSFGVIGRF